MRRLLIVFILAFMYNGCSAQNPQKQSLSSEITRIAEEEIKDKHIPSLAIGVVKDGKVVLSKAFGYADVESKKPATDSTIYQMGSVTKMLTGHILSQLVNEQTIGLDDTLASYFPNSIDFPAGPNNEIITVRHIATHSAGFPRYPENLERVDPNPILGFSKTKLYRGIEMVTPETVPGSEYHYSNFGYGVLGTAMENATGMTLNELMSKYIFNPIGMNSSSLHLDDKLNENLATPYLEVDPYKTTQPWQMGALSAAGNVFSTIDDMNTFMLFLLEKNEVNKIQQQSYLTINDSWSYALGCFVIDSEKWETTIIYHGGDVDGYASSLTLYPEHDLGFVILTNYGEGQIVGEVFTKLGDAVNEFILTKTNR